jgi:hypothetical protein
MAGRLLVLLLAAAVALAPAAQAMPAAAMTAAMAAAVDAGPDMCPGCSDGAAGADVCGAICLSVPQVGTLAGCDVLLADLQRDSRALRRSASPGHSPPPEPAPPKTVSSS